MADDNVKRVVIPPKRNVSPLLLAGLLHYVSIRVYLFFAPLITRVWRTYLQALRAVTLPYQCCCTIMMFAIFWPFIALVAWFYACFRLFEYYGWPLREVPIVGTLMGPLNVREPPVRRAAAAAAAGAAGAPPGGVRHRPAAATQAAPAQAAPAAAPVAGRGPTAAAQAQPVGAEASGVKTEAAAASGGATASAPAAEEASIATAAATTSAGATAGAAGDAAGATGGAAAGAEQGAKPKRSARDRSPDGWFGPPPPEEGGPEPPYVPYDPDFVDPTDYLPEEELAKYKFYKRRTPYRRVP